MRIGLYAPADGAAQYDAGLVPAGNGTHNDTYLRKDGTWSSIPAASMASSGVWGRSPLPEGRNETASSGDHSNQNMGGVMVGKAGSAFGGLEIDSDGRMRTSPQLKSKVIFAAHPNGALVYTSPLTPPPQTGLSLSERRRNPC